MSAPSDFLRATQGRMIARSAPAFVVLGLALTGHGIAALVLFCLVSCIIGYLTLSTTTRLLGPVTTHLSDDSVLLTIDDGPSPDTTPALLDLLDQHGVKAVFFLIGDRVKQWPHLAREIAKRGHTIGNHSMTHPAARFWMLGRQQTWREIADCQETLREAVGEAPHWFRAPVGHYNQFTHPALDSLGMELMSWSCRGVDGVDTNVPRVLARIGKTLKPGAIVLLHEATGPCLEIIGGVLKMIEERGLRTKGALGNAKL